MKFYVDAQPFSLVLEARDIQHAMERMNDINQGRNIMPDQGIDFDINRVSTKPSRKTEYREI